MFQKSLKYSIVMSIQSEQQFNVGKTERGLTGLWSARGRGAKPKWKTEDLEYIETCLNEEGRTYNSIQLGRKLKQERAGDLRNERLKRILKKKDIVGKEPDRATRKNKINNLNRSKKQI